MAARGTGLAFLYHVLYTGLFQVAVRCLSAGWNGSQRNRPGILISCIVYWFVSGGRQVFERWMEWQPEEQAWHSYIMYYLLVCFRWPSGV